MRILFRGLIAWLIICFVLQAHTPNLAFAGLPGQSAQNRPNIISSPEEDYSAAGNAARNDKGSHKWLWTVLAVVAIGAAVGMGGSSSNGGGGGQSGASAGDGTISTGW